MSGQFCDWVEQNSGLSALTFDRWSGNPRLLLQLPKSYSHMHLPVSDNVALFLWLFVVMSYKKIHI